MGASSWLTQNHEGFTRLAMNGGFPSTQDLRQSVQRQVNNIDRPQGRRQHANLAGLEHVSMVKNPAAKLIRMKSSRVLRFHIVC